MFIPREGQSEILKYKSGKLGITAVPGSGKTHTLSFLAAKLIAESQINDDQEILIVTLVNSAVNNFAARISDFLTEFGLIPGVGYRVRTLHGLAYDIVREQPQLAGMDNQFSIADERTSNDILSFAAVNWMRTHPDVLLGYAAEGSDPGQQKRIWGDLIQSIARNGISLCKDLLINADNLLSCPNLMKDPLFAMVQKIYSDYEKALHDRGAVDFADLIRYAFTILNNNPGYLSMLQERWPYILEDEAQDSSLIQEKLLSLLSVKDENWVRVGDPNQAIFETFTTADPRLLREFVSREDVKRVNLPRSGRSTRSIIFLANYLIQWTREHHPKIELRSALDEPFIKQTAAEDPQPNPPDEPAQVILYKNELSPEKEIKLVAGSAEKWIKENPDKTAAILIPRNARGAEIAEELSNNNVPVFELLSTSKTTRETASILGCIFSFFAKPLIRRNLTRAFQAVAFQICELTHLDVSVDNIIKRLEKLSTPEILFTVPDGIDQYLDDEHFNKEEEIIFRKVFNQFQYWQSALLLPIDEMTITIGTDLFRDPADLALTHRIALILQKAKEYYPEWHLEDYADELIAISNNRYRLQGFSADRFGFNPDDHTGEVVISTIHKAKGLEWDRVYLPSVNNYNFPSLDEKDQYISEKWFVKDRRNLEAEVLISIRNIEEDQAAIGGFDFSSASQHARRDFCAERLRLLYVGITRARKELIITWNNGKNGDCFEALPLRALRKYWEQENVK